MIKTEMWTSGEEREDVSDGMGGARLGEQWHFQNALFEDIRSTTTTKPSKSSSNNSMSRRRYSCLACGEIKRWDQLTQHYKKFVQFDSLGIPCVPDQKQMSDKVYQHTAIFFEKNFTRDRMPMYKDHVTADSLQGSGEDRPVLSTAQSNLYPDLAPVKPKEFGQHSLFFSPTFPLQSALAPLKVPPLKLPHAATGRGARKRRLVGGSVSSSGSGMTQSVTVNSPSQSRRFYKCLGCGAAKRWDRLTDHYRKVRSQTQSSCQLISLFSVRGLRTSRPARGAQPGHHDTGAVCPHHGLQGPGLQRGQDASVQRSLRS